MLSEEVWQADVTPAFVRMPTIHNMLMRMMHCVFVFLSILVTARVAHLVFAGLLFFSFLSLVFIYSLVVIYFITDLRSPLIPRLTPKRETG